MTTYNMTLKFQSVLAIFFNRQNPSSKGIDIIVDLKGEKVQKKISAIAMMLSQLDGILCTQNQRDYNATNQA